MKKFLIPIYVIVGIISLYLLVYFANFLATLSLRSFIHKLDKVEYENQLVPEITEEGYYTFTTDGDFKIMQVADLHIGGGFWSMKKDRKTVYEISKMVQTEKPDLVVLTGDNTFAVPGPVYNGGGTLDNRMAARDVIEIFETLGVYFTTVFGNHDTESFGYFNREAVGRLYEMDKFEHCIFESNFNTSSTTKDLEGNILSGYGVTNQCILIKKTSGDIEKAILCIDSNDYTSQSVKATLASDYDTIHDSQVYWAYNTIKSLSDKCGHPVKSIVFEHIPTTEFSVAYKELYDNDFNDTLDTKYISGVWGEERPDGTDGIQVWYGGINKKDVSLEDMDLMFELLSKDGLDTIEAIFCGHDHANSAVVEYKGVTLSYGYSMDNTAYDNIALYGMQRGNTTITISSDGSISISHNNAYDESKGYGIDSSKYFNVDTDGYVYDNPLPQK